MSNDARTFQSQPDRGEDAPTGEQLPKEPQDIPKWAAGEPVATAQDEPPVIPLSPTDVGKLLDGMVKAIRANGGVMFTISFIIMTVIGVAAGVFAVYAGGTVETHLDGTGAAFRVEDSSSWAAELEFFMTALPGLSSVVVAGVLVQTVANAVIGRKVTLGQALHLLKGRIWRVIVTSVLTGIIVFGSAALLIYVSDIVEPLLPDAFILTILFLLYYLAGFIVILRLSIRLYFATMVAALEKASPFVALKRSWQLASGAFWRIFGRVLVLFTIMGVATGILSGITGQIGQASSGAVGSFTSVFLLCLTAATMMPFSAAYDSLMYLDERMRRDDYGPVLENAWEVGR